ncbi:retrovirus-related pol polyprotein from transposon TNT 1-94 [Tanacetum coccineum]
MERLPRRSPDSLKALDEGYSSKNYVRKFLRSLHLKWRAKVTTIEESKDLTSLSLDELIGNLKVHELIIKKDSKIVKGKGERRSLALKAKKESSDEESLNFKSKYEEYVMTVRDFKSSLREEVGSGEEDDEKAKYKTCLMAQASSEICLGINLEPDEWIQDSGCTKHMTGNRKIFSIYKAYNRGNVIFGSNLSGNIIGKAPKAWYDRFKAFLIKHEYNMGMVDNTLFTKKKGSNLIIVQIYVNDVIFGSTCEELCDDFAKIMHDEFEMSMMGELNFFLRLQIKQLEDDIFFNQSMYIKQMLKEFGLEDSKQMKTPMSSNTNLMKDEECESVDRTKYRGMIGSLLYLTEIMWVEKALAVFVRSYLTSWFSKKQIALAISMTEAEYVSAEKACQQALWMKRDLIDYDIILDDIPIMCDNKGLLT